MQSGPQASFFFDSQNILFSMQERPEITPKPENADFDVLKVSKYICAEHGWLFKHAFVYSGVPSVEQTRPDIWEKEGLTPELSTEFARRMNDRRSFWVARGAHFGRQSGLITFRQGTIRFQRPGGRCVRCDLPLGECACFSTEITEDSYKRLHEVGVDVQLAVDVVLESSRTDIIVILSADQDFAGLPLLIGEELAGSGLNMPEFYSAVLAKSPDAKNSNKKKRRIDDPIRNFTAIRLPLADFNSLRYP